MVETAVGMESGGEKMLLAGIEVECVPYDVGIWKFKLAVQIVMTTV
jgi:hypothetical protein